MEATLILSGKSGSGKDAFAKLLADTLKAHHKRTIIIHFADVLPLLLIAFLTLEAIFFTHFSTSQAVDG